MAGGLRFQGFVEHEKESAARRPPGSDRQELDGGQNPSGPLGGRCSIGTSAHRTAVASDASARASGETTQPLGGRGRVAGWGVGQCSRKWSGRTERAGGGVRTIAELAENEPVGKRSCLIGAR